MIEIIDHLLIRRQLIQKKSSFYFYQQNFRKTAGMKYLLQPIPKSNPYDKQQPINPYSLIQPQGVEQSAAHHLLDCPAVKLFCESCKKQLTHHVHVVTGAKEYCVGCLAGLETLPEQYEAVQKLDYPLFESAWTAYQEVLLLDSMDKWGYGNWKDVQQYMEYFGAKFTQDQIETHYNTFYLSDKTYIPRFSQNLIERKMEQQNCKSIIPNQVSIVSLTTNIREDSMNYAFEEIDDFSHQAPITSIPNQPIPTTRIKGYNSLRKEFQTDYDQNAQKNIANLQFRDDDLPEQRQIKYKMIMEYNQRLQKRYEVHDFMIEHRLLDAQYQKETQENITDYEKQAAAQLKAFMRFSTFQVHNQLVRRVALQKQLKSIIEGMRSYRRISNTGRLKQTFQLLRKQSNQNPVTPTKSRGRPRKIIHVDNSQKSTASNSQCMPLSKKAKNQQQLFKRLKINTKDLKCIIKQSAQKKNGEGFRYKGVEVMVVERK